MILFQVSSRFCILFVSKNSLDFGSWSDNVCKHRDNHFSSLILELLGFQVSSLFTPVLLSQQIYNSKQIMAAFQGGAAANNICYRAESWRYLGTATFMFKELHLEKLIK